jgi:hypothetical protein
MPARPACGIQRRPFQRIAQETAEILPSAQDFLFELSPASGSDPCNDRPPRDLPLSRPQGQAFEPAGRGILRARLRTANDAANASAGQPLRDLSRLIFACSVQRRIVRLQQMSFVGHSVPDQNKLRHDHSSPAGGLRLQEIEVYDKHVY